MKTVGTSFILLLIAGTISAQNFNVERIQRSAMAYTVSVDLEVEVSFGIQSTDAKYRAIGTVVSADGLVIFDGSDIDSDDPFSQLAGMQVNAEPKSIEVSFMDGTRYPADFIGIDRFTKVGFCRITAENPTKFTFLEFAQRNDIRVGDWFLTFMLLPEFVSPSLGSDIGMVSALLTEPEEFILTVGFNDLEIGSVLYDTNGTAIGILGELLNPAMAGMSPSQMMESFSQMEDFLPLLGVVDARKIQRLIADPPARGTIDRGWLGIYLQALTADIAEFWGILNTGGIIINEVVRDSPADSAGLRTGDIIVKLGGEEIRVDREENLSIFQRQIADLGAGAPVDFTILRRHNGKVDTLEISTLLARAPLTPSEAPDYKDSNFEVRLRDMVFADYNIYNLDRRTFKGVVVKEVEQGSWGEVGGLVPGDIIQTIHGKRIESIGEAKAMLIRITEEKPKEVVFFVWRANKTLFINIKTNW
ncbi:MAG: PDZ domain-containing protein [Candidatus Zixiibacteriota bacterium]|nr:MAG: PDZ domain-containing protein [candidate division Zixibacteria bacterium]